MLGMMPCNIHIPSIMSVKEWLPNYITAMNLVLQYKNYTFHTPFWHYDSAGTTRIAYLYISSTVSTILIITCRLWPSWFVSGVLGGRMSARYKALAAHATLPSNCLSCNYKTDLPQFTDDQGLIKAMHSLTLAHEFIWSSPCTAAGWEYCQFHWTEFQHRPWSQRQYRRDVEHVHPYWRQHVRHQFFVASPITACNRPEASGQKDDSIFSQLLAPIDDFQQVLTEFSVEVAQGTDGIYRA